MLPESNCEYRTHTYWEQRYAALLAADPVAAQGNVDAVDMATTATDKANVKPTLNSSSDDADLQHDNTTSTEIVFDWFKKYADLQQIFHALITDKHARILMLGCGNSSRMVEGCSNDARTL